MTQSADMSKWTKSIFIMTPLTLLGVMWRMSLDDGFKEIRRGNFDKAIELFQTAGGSDLNVREAQLGLAFCYWYGIGVDQDCEKAVEILEGRDAKTDNDESSPLKLWGGHEKSIANYLLGMYYLKKGTDDAQKKGLDYLKTAAAAGHALSQFELGRYYYYSQVNNREPFVGGGSHGGAGTQAQDFLSDAIDNPALSESNRSISNYLLGMYYLKKIGDAQKKGLDYLKTAAAAGHALSQFELGKYYHGKVHLESFSHEELSQAQLYLKAALDNPELPENSREAVKELIESLNSPSGNSK